MSQTTTSPNAELTNTASTDTEPTNTASANTAPTGRSRRRFAGVTAAVVGSAALVAVPALVGGTSIASSPTAQVSGAHQIAPAANPPAPTAKPAPKPAATDGSDRASRSSSRATLPAPKTVRPTAKSKPTAKPKGTAKSASVASGSPKSIARAQLASRGWSGQFSCLNSLWQKESGWRVTADNPSSSAYGIPQALPGSKMASAGSDWRTNPATQIEWGLDYIDSTYGTPCAAWSHSKANNWY